MFLEIKDISFKGNVLIYVTFQVGRNNPKIELWLADMSSGNIAKKQILPPFSLANDEAHFSWVTWPTNDQFAITWMNRVQVR
jgi:hypothetical protein